MVRITILWVNHTAVMGGAEASLLELAAGMDRTRFDVMAAIPGPGPLAEAFAAYGISTVRLPFRHFRRTRHPARLAGYGLHLLTTARRLERVIRERRIDLVHANSNTAQLYAGLAAARAGVPCLWHCRDLVRLGALGRPMAARADRVVCISQAVRAALEAEGIAGRAVVIPNGIDPDAWAGRTAESDPRREWGVAPDAFLVGMAAQLVPWKRHDLFLEAAARIAAAVPGARFVLVGGALLDSAASYERALQKQAERLGLGQALLLAGPRSDMAAVLRSFNVLLHPADREPFGRVILEAMAVGTPVVAVDACGPAEIIRPGVDGLLAPPGDAAALAEATIGLARDRVLAERLAQAGRERVRAAFSRRRHVDQMEALYATVVRERASVCPQVGYVLAAFPSLSETFILREMEAVAQQGVGVVPLALQRPATRLLHAAARPFLARVRYRPATWPGRVGAGLAAGLGSRPGRFLALAGAALRRGDPDTGSRLRALLHLLDAAALSRAARRAGVVRIHAHFAQVTADVGAAMARLLGVPFSLSVHARDLFTGSADALRRRLEPAAFVAVCTWRGWDRLREQVPEFPVERLVLLRHGLPLGVDAVRASTEPLVLAVGRLEEKKGFEVWIDACARLRREGVVFRGVLVGDGPRRDRLAARRDAAGLRGVLELVGAATQEQVMDWYARARVVAVPSVPAADGDQDGLPNVLLEAMAMRIPVVASAFSAIPEAVTDGVEGLLVPPGDPAALAAAIRRLLEDPGEGRRMGERGRARVCAAFDSLRNGAELAARFGGTRHSTAAGQGEQAGDA